MYFMTLLFDVLLFTLTVLLLLVTKRQSWLGAFRHIIFRFSSLSLTVRIIVSFLLPTRAFLALVVLCNLAHALLWLYAFHRLDTLIRTPEIRSVQVWIHPRKVEVVSIFKQVLGTATFSAACRGRDSGGCAICLQPLLVRSDDRRTLSLRRERPGIMTARRMQTAGVMELLETPCKHMYHALCIDKCVQRKCPLCKRDLGTVQRVEVAFP
jgi:hypothetical protein